MLGRAARWLPATPGRAVAKKTEPGTSLLLGRFPQGLWGGHQEVGHLHSWRASSCWCQSLSKWTCQGPFPSRGASTVSPHPTQTRWLCPHRRQERPHQASMAAGELGCPAVPLPTGSDTSLSLSWQLSEGKMMERRKKIALELSELVVYCRPVPFDEESEHLLVSCHRRQTPWRRRPRCVPPGCCPGLWLACS